MRGGIICGCPLSRTKLGVRLAYKVDRHAVAGYYSVPTIPEEDYLDVGIRLVALEGPAHYTGPFVGLGLVGLVCATSPMVLDQQQS